MELTQRLVECQVEEEELWWVSGCLILGVWPCCRLASWLQTSSSGDPEVLSWLGQLVHILVLLSAAKLQLLVYRSQPVAVNHYINCCNSSHLLIEYYPPEALIDNSIRHFRKSLLDLVEKLFEAKLSEFS